MLIKLKAKPQEIQQIYGDILTYFSQEVHPAFYTDLCFLNKICTFIGTLIYQGKISFVSAVRQYAGHFQELDNNILYQIIV